MWTLVLKEEDGEYDCVPSKWIISPEECVYPDKSKSTVTKLAKQQADPETEWGSVKIKIIKRDVDSFDRCMGNAIRIQVGKSTFTSSENEDRGKGKRKKLSTRREDSSSESSCEGPSIKRTPQKKLSRSQIPQPPVRSLYSIHQKPILYKEPLTPTRSPSLTTFYDSPVSLSSPLTSFQSQTPTFNKPSTKTNNTLSNKCHLSSKKKHSCTFTLGPLSQTSIANQLCTLSRNIYVLNQTIKDYQQQMISRIESIPNTITTIDGENDRKQHSAMANEEDDEDELIQKAGDMLKKFPFSEIEEFLLFNRNLGPDTDTEKKTIAVINLVGQKSSHSRFVTSVMRKMMEENLLKHFSWKGHSRSSHSTKKNSFSDLAVCKLLISVVKRRFPEEKNLRSKIEKAIAGYLAQSVSKLQKMTDNEQRAGGVHEH